MENNKHSNNRKVTKNFFSSESYNQVLFQSENFVVIPSLGSLIEGWLLIVPKEYSLCMGNLSSTLLLELKNLTSFVTAILKSEYGHVVSFEHGAHLPNNAIGCGVDYAHLHLVPLDINLKSELTSNNYLLDWNEVSGIELTSLYAANNLPYLYIEKDGQHFIASNSNIPSQLFRKIIANFLGMPNQYDWKSFSKIDQINRTIARLENYPDFRSEINYSLCEELIDGK